MQLTLCQAISGSAEAPGIQYQYTYLLFNTTKSRAWGIREEKIKMER